jgi:hypothetical protein
VEDLLALIGLGSLLAAGLRVLFRVRPLWAGMHVYQKLLYVVAVGAVQMGCLAGAEAILFRSRGGLRLFEPHLVVSSSASDHHGAYVYRDGFLTCRYELYVARPGSITMCLERVVPRRACDEPLPVVRWDDNGTPRLFEAGGASFEPQGLGMLGGGC